MPLPKPSLNPFNITSTDLPPNLLLMVKLITLGLLFKGYYFQLSDHFLPMWPIFDLMGPPAVFENVLQVVFILFSMLLLFNRSVRLSCFMLGLLFLVVVLSSRASYSNAKVCCGFIFLLTSLQKKGDLAWLIRWQIVIIYAGSFLNKFLDPDWRSGQYFEHWLNAIIHNPHYNTIEALFPPMALSLLMCWLTIATELALAVGFAVKKWNHLAIWTGIYFHCGSLVLTWSDFGVFIIAMLSSYLAFVEWPAALKFYRRGKTAVLEMPGRTYTGFLAFKKRILYDPLTYFVLVAIMGTLNGNWIGLKVRAVEIMLLLFCPVPEMIYAFRQRAKNT